jgi:hypothetical protein
VSRSLRRFLLVAIAAASVLGVVVLGYAYRIVHHVPESVEELSRLQTSELAAESLVRAFADLEQVLLVRAGYQPAPASSTPDAAVSAVGLLLNELRVSSDGLPLHDDVLGLVRIAGTVAVTPDRRRVFQMDRQEALAALERLAAAQAALTGLRTKIAEAARVRRDVYRRAQTQVRWLSVSALVAGLALAAFVFTSGRRHLLALGGVSSVARARLDRHDRLAPDRRAARGPGLDGAET